MNVSELLDRITGLGGSLVVVDGEPRLRAPAALPDELIAAARQHSDELIAYAIEHAEARSPLVEHVATEWAPVVRFTVVETEDVAEDVAFLHRVRTLLEAWPGANHIEMRVVTLEGQRPVVRWRAYASEELRRVLARLLVERSGARAGAVPAVVDEERRSA